MNAQGRITTRHVLLTVNAAWNLAHFRAPVIGALAARGDRLTALAPADDAVPRLEAAGVRHVPLPMDSRGLNPLRDAGLTARLYRQFRAEAPDVILSWTIKNNLYGAVAARRLSLPFVPNVSGLGTAFLSGALVQRVAETLYSRAFRGLPVVFFQNEEDRDLFLTRRLVTAAQARLLPGSGIDLSHFAPAPLPDGAPVFLFVGRVLRDKGVQEFVDAARMVRARHPEARFRILGAADADNRTALGMATVQDWVAEGVIDYLGTTDDVRPALTQASCVVLPSYREGAPRVLIEAAAMARPVIATDVPGCRQVVDPGVTGLLCAPRDAADLARAMEEMIALPAPARAAMAQAARARMERLYDDRIVVEAYLDAIDRVTAKGRM